MRACVSVLWLGPALEPFAPGKAHGPRSCFCSPEALCHALFVCPKLVSIRGGIGQLMDGAVPAEEEAAAIKPAPLPQPAAIPHLPPERMLSKKV